MNELEIIAAALTRHCYNKPFARRNRAGHGIVILDGILLRPANSAAWKLMVTGGIRI